MARNENSVHRAARKREARSEEKRLKTGAESAVGKRRLLSGTCGDMRTFVDATIVDYVETPAPSN